MEKYKLVFLGTTDFSVKILEGLHHHPQVKIQVVITQPDRPAGRKKTLKSSLVKDWANKHHIPLEQPSQLRDLSPLIKRLEPDFLVTAAYGQKVPPSILQAVRIEALNVHGSLLPRYRGGAPVQMALWNGDGETGVTVMRMVEKMDAGPIFGQERIVLDETMSSGELMKVAADKGSKLLNQLIAPIATRQVQPVEQDATRVSFAHNIQPAQEKINWNQTAFQIHNQIRALSPQPGAFTIYQDQRLKIFKSKVISSSSDVATQHLPGTVIGLNNQSFTVQTGQGVLEVIELQKAGKNKINAGLFGKNNLEIGTQFK